MLNRCYNFFHRQNTIEDLVSKLNNPKELMKFLKKGTNEGLVNHVLSRINHTSSDALNARYINVEYLTPLYLACTSGRQDIAEILLAYHADKNQPSTFRQLLNSKYSGKSLLPYDFTCKITPIQTALSNKHFNLARYLLSMGANRPDDAHCYLDKAVTKDDLIFLWETVNEKSYKCLKMLISFKDQTAHHRELLESLHAATDEETKLKFIAAFVYACETGDNKVVDWFKMNREIDHTHLCNAFVTAWKNHDTTIVDKLIVDWCFDIRTPDDAGNTALDYLDEEQKSSLRDYLDSQKKEHNDKYKQFKRIARGFDLHADEVSDTEVDCSEDESEFVSFSMSK